MTLARLKTQLTWQWGLHWQMAIGAAFHREPAPFGEGRPCYIFVVWLGPLSGSVIYDPAL